VTRSMTGFGSASLALGERRASITVRSLNHRYLELVLHLPRRLQGLEPEIRRRVQARLQRGKVEVTVAARGGAGEARAIEVERGLVSALVGALRELRDEHGLVGEVGIAEVARFPGALEVVELDPAPESQARGDVLGLLDRALDDLETMRRDEGRNLETELRSLLAEVEAAAGRIACLADSGRTERQAVLRARVGEIVAGSGLDEARMHQEVVRLVERSDVAEELARLCSHVDLMRQAIAGSSPCGKRLDFLAQELMREANTLCSKGVSGAVVHEAVGLKAVIERLREQVQNVE
jgi:uncharacterized protein (TIGR00255 family)